MIWLILKRWDNFPTFFYHIWILYRSTGVFPICFQGDQVICYHWKSERPTKSYCKPIHSAAALKFWPPKIVMARVYQLLIPKRHWRLTGNVNAFQRDLKVIKSIPIVQDEEIVQEFDANNFSWLRALVQKYLPGKIDFKLISFIWGTKDAQNTQ